MMNQKLSSMNPLPSIICTELVADAVPLLPWLHGATRLLCVQTLKVACGEEVVADKLLPVQTLPPLSTNCAAILMLLEVLESVPV